METEQTLINWNTEILNNSSKYICTEGELIRVMFTQSVVFSLSVSVCVCLQVCFFLFSFFFKELCFSSCHSSKRRPEITRRMEQFFFLLVVGSSIFRLRAGNVLFVSALFFFSSLVSFHFDLPSDRATGSVTELSCSCSIQQQREFVRVSLTQL